MKNPLFSYANLYQKLIVDKLPIIEDNETGFFAMLGPKVSGADGFIQLGCQATIGPKTREGRIAEKFGLKFHIALPEWNREKYAEGWDIVADILIEHKVRFSKVAHDDNPMSAGSGSQRGKDITIYTYQQPDKNAAFWFMLAQKITEALVAAKVDPGFAPKDTGDRADIRLNGSNYITYRYDRDLPPNIQDFCTGANIDVPNQASPASFPRVKESEDEAIKAENTTNQSRV